MDATNGTEPEGLTPAISTPTGIEQGEPLTEAGGGRANPILDRFWVAVRRLPKYVRLAANLARDGRVPASAKAALVVGGAYTISPIDLVPGFIPVAGQLDDLLVLLLSLRTAVNACPPEVGEEHLTRVGLRREDFDDDLAAARDTAVWLVGKGWRAGRAAATRGGRRLQTMWRGRPGQA